MIVGGHGRSGAGNRGGGRGVDPVQPRDRATGARCQGSATSGAPAPGFGGGARQARPLAAGDGTVDLGLATAGGGSAAGAVGGGATGAGGRPAGAAVPRSAHAGRARGTLRVSGDVGDCAGGGGRCADGAAAGGPPHARGADDHVGACGPGVGQHASVCAARAWPSARGGDDDGRGRCVRLEWRGDQARLRRPRRPPSRHGGSVGPVDGCGVGSWCSERVERPAGASGDPGGAGCVRYSDGDPGGAGAAAAGRALQRHAAGRGAAGRVAAGAGHRRRAARALTPAACVDGRRARE